MHEAADLHHSRRVAHGQVEDEVDEREDDAEPAHEPSAVRQRMDLDEAVHPQAVEIAFSPLLPEIPGFSKNDF